MFLMQHVQGLHPDSTLDLSSGQTTPALAVASSLTKDLSAFLTPLLEA